MKKTSLKTLPVNSELHARYKIFVKKHRGIMQAYTEKMIQYMLENEDFFLKIIMSNDMRNIDLN